jgi:hypothetical protein
LTRILIVTRDEADIRSELQPREKDHGPLFQPVSISELRVGLDDVRGDLARFAQSIVDSRLPNKSEELRHILAAELADRSRGMFLWARLNERSLSPSMNPDQLLMAVQAMPLGPKRMYERNWSEILRLQRRKRRRSPSCARPFCNAPAHSARNCRCARCI